MNHDPSSKEGNSAPSIRSINVLERHVTMITRPSFSILSAILLFSLSPFQLLAHESDTIAVPGAKRVLVFSGIGKK